MGDALDALLKSSEVEPDDDRPLLRLLDGELDAFLRYARQVLVSEKLRTCFTLQARALAQSGFEMLGPEGALSEHLQTVAIRLTERELPPELVLPPNPPVRSLQGSVTSSRSSRWQ